MTDKILPSDGLAAILFAIDKLNGKYVAALDWQDWNAWLASFDEDSFYSVTSRQNAESSLPLCYMIDDCRARLIDRVKFITEVWASTIEPYRTRHIIQRLSVDEVGDNQFKVISNFMVMFTQNNEASSALATGYYEDIVKIIDGHAVFKRKTAYIDGTPARYLAYPL